MKYYIRFCSEYGFESLPSYKTIKSFTDEENPNICRNVMQAHQKCVLGNEKLMFYMAQMVQFPQSIPGMVYASQLVQADAIRCDVEHMRRNRGVCMGSLYWQVNDSNPVISWSSVDYYGRWKALHYYAKRFYAPVLVSCLESDISDIKINVSSELLNECNAVLKWALRDNGAKSVRSGENEITIKPLCAENHLSFNLSDLLSTTAEKRMRYLTLELVCENGESYYGRTLFVRPKEFDFLPSDVSITIEETSDSLILTVEASVYVKSLYLDLSEYDCVFSDNWFDINGSAVTVTVDKTSVTLNGMKMEITLDDFAEQLEYADNSNYIKL